jgi:hypothetical protein
MNTGIGATTSLRYDRFARDVLDGIAEDPLDCPLIGLDLPPTESFTIVSKPEL